MKLISDEKLVAIRTDVYQDEDRDKYAGNCIVTAAYAQLESCEKEHNAVLREIFNWIENARTTPLGYDQYGSYLWDADVKAKRQKYGGLND